MGKDTFTDSIEETKAFKKFNTTIPDELSRSSLMEDSSYFSSDSESQNSRSQNKQDTRSDSPSVVIQVDAHNAKGQSNVQHVSGDPHEGTQLANTANEKRVETVDPQEELAI